MADRPLRANSGVPYAANGRRLGTCATKTPALPYSAKPPSPKASEPKGYVGQAERARATPAGMTSMPSISTRRASSL